MRYVDIIEQRPSHFGEKLRTFLFLQGPVGDFFRVLAGELRLRGHKTIRVQFTGGDVVDWLCPDTLWYRGRRAGWPAWAAGLIRREGVTDLVMLSDHRQFHCEAAILAEIFGIRLFVLEEGYLRPGFVTFEEGGINGSSKLPDTPEDVLRLAAGLPDFAAPPKLPPTLARRVARTLFYLAGRLVLWPFFPFYTTHRPYSAFREYVLGWLPRLPLQGKRKEAARKELDALRASGRPFFFFPLQLDADAQVRRYSPFGGTLESIAHVLASFARFAPQECGLLIKNHPLDCGLIPYGRYISGYADALGLAGRVHYVETGDGEAMMRQSRGVVLLNSTMGLSGLRMQKPVYYLGKAVCAMPGLGAAEPHQSLREFWRNPSLPDERLLEAFLRVLCARALVPGDFFSKEGQRLAVAGMLRRLGLEGREA